jgi:hypothetical protein
MSAVYGVDTSYYAIAPIHQDLNIAGAGGSEFEFLSGYSEDSYSDRPMMTWDQWMQWILFNEQYSTPKQKQEIMAKAVKAQNKTLPKDSTGNDTASTIYNVISSDPRLSKMKNLIDYVDYGKPFSAGITMFAPVNDQFDKILEYPLTIAYKPVAALQALRYHILPYIIKPWQMEGRKLKLRTDFEKQIIESDWTGGKQLLMNPINLTYLPPPAGSFTNPPGDPVPARTDNWFPKKDWEVQILASIQCTNGMLYIISRPIVWSDLL